MQFAIKSQRAKGLLLATTAMLAPMTPALAQDASQTGPQLNASAEADTPTQRTDEIVVTAQKRTESVQRVPISIQALSPEVLEQHKTVGIDDYVKLLPSVSLSTLGPGQTTVYFRGISTGSAAFAASSGMYFDETPVESGGTSLDLHLYDVARVEALSGPQGTLFGASSLSGTIRIISNKPDPGKFSAGFDAQGDKFGKGAYGGQFEAFANLPISQTIAFRMSGYYEKDGGYIDVVPGTVRYTLGDNDPTNDIIKTNAAEVHKDVNSVETYGGRAALGIDLDDSWTITPQIMAQRQKSNGTFLWDPSKGDLAVSTYAPAGNDDRWYLASLTVEGKIGNLDLVYAGSQLHRHTLNDADYTYYSVAYDQFPGYTKFPLPGGGYLDPTQRYHSDTTTNRMSHELRLSSSWDKPINFTVGAFYQRLSTAGVQNYYIPGVGALNPATLSVPPVVGDTIFLLDTYRVAKDYAAFGEVSLKITPRVTLTGGIRGFISKASSSGFVGIYSNALSKGCSVPLTAPCSNTNSYVRSSGETHKVNLTWQVDQDRMLYATYSTGFRPGGPNSFPGVKNYAPDTLSNYEVGLKSYWFDRKLRVNAAAYYELWDGIQYRLAFPGANGLTAAYNAGNARVWGGEMDFTARLGQFTLSGTGSINDARLTTNFCAIQSFANPNPYPSCSTAAGNVRAPKGTRLPNQPIFKTSVTGRYEFVTGELNDFLSATVNHQSGSRSFLGLYEDGLLGDTKAFSTVDFSIGTQFSGSKIELFIQNAFDERGELNHNTFCNITICGPIARRVYSVKPQFFGIKFSQRFE